MNKTIYWSPTLCGLPLFVPLIVIYFRDFDSKTVYARVDKKKTSRVPYTYTTVYIAYCAVDESFKEFQLSSENLCVFFFFNTTLIIDKWYTWPAILNYINIPNLNPASDVRTDSFGLIALVYTRVRTRITMVLLTANNSRLKLHTVFTTLLWAKTKIHRLLSLNCWLNRFLNIFKEISKKFLPFFFFCIIYIWH